MEWDFIINTGRQVLKFRAQLIYESNQIQKIRVTIADRSIVIENDLPFVRAIKSKGKIQWRLREGKILNPEVFLEVVDNVEDYIKIHWRDPNASWNKWK